ncbi:hypothetical protein Mkiyose1665_26460 [Mycobacterium kiyosense]|nr:hypothetical protein Mkiyose1665_26460 [Mycobacterium kiyosense]
MRIARSLAALLTVLTAGLLLATPVGAQPPSKLTEHITDTTGALTDSDRAAVSSAIDRLYRDRRLQLWVVYVDNFSRFKPDNWAENTRAASKMGAQDALLAVATNTKLYAFSVPGLSVSELSSLRSTKIDPEVNAKDWGGAPRSPPPTG